MDTTTQIKNDSPLVSVLMLTYNRAQYIGEAIHSVLAQTYTNFELIIIDDGSTDDTAKVVQEFNDSRIKYIKQTTNQGLLVRRNESLTQAKGDYVAVLDSDDIWCSKDKLTKQVGLLINNPDYAVVGSFIIIVDKVGQEITRATYAQTDTDIRNNILMRNQFAHSSVLMRKSVIDKTAGYSTLKAAEDLGLFLQLGLHGKFANLPEYLTKYRIHGISESTDKRKIITHVLKVIKLHKNHYPKYYLACLKYCLYLLFLKLKSLF